MFCRCRRLAEVVAHGAEHHRQLLRPRQVVDTLACLIDHLQRVHPDVALGMPLGFLRAADQGVQLGKQLRDDRRGRARARGRLTGAAPAAAFRLRPRRAPAANRRAPSIGTARASRRSRASSKRAANCTARKARRLSSENVAGSTARSRRRSEIAAAVVRIEVLAGQRIPGDRVDREVAPPRGLGGRHDGVARRRRSPGGRVRISIRAAAATRRCRRSCRPESSRRRLRRGRATRAAIARAATAGRRPRGRCPSSRNRRASADRAPSRRRSARGRRRRGPRRRSRLRARTRWYHSSRGPAAAGCPRVPVRAWRRAPACGRIA